MIGSRGVLSPVWGASVDPFHRLVDAGMAVASVSYRLSSEARFPAQLHDVAAAARYLVVRADELGIDLSRVAAWGASSGGQLALLAALLRQDEVVSGRGAAVAMPDFAAVVDWCAPVDLRVPLPTLGMPPPEPVERLLGADPAEVLDLARLASPLLQVRQPLRPR
jgi:acetyl esterase/lipase